MKYGDEWFDGNFAPLISPQLFEAVQEVLQTRERPRKRKIKHDFLFTGLFRCTECDSMISAQWTTNRHGTKYRYYRCSKKRGRCSQSYVQEKDLVMKLQAQLQTISLCDRYTDWMFERVKEWEYENISASQSEIQNLSAKIKVDEERMEKLLSTYLDGDVPKEIYLKKKDIIMRSLATLKEEMKDFESGRNQWVEPLREWILDTKQATFLSSSDNFSEIASFVKKVGTNPTVRNKSPHFSVSAPSDFVAKRQKTFGFSPIRSAHSAVAPSAQPFSLLSEAEVSFCGGHGTRRQY